MSVLLPLLCGPMMATTCVGTRRAAARGKLRGRASPTRSLKTRGRRRRGPPKLVRISKTHSCIALAHLVVKAPGVDASGLDKVAQSWLIHLAVRQDELDLLPILRRHYGRRGTNRARRGGGGIRSGRIPCPRLSRQEKRAGKRHALLPNAAVWRTAHDAGCGASLAFRASGRRPWRRWGRSRAARGAEEALAPCEGAEDHLGHLAPRDDRPDTN